MTGSVAARAAKALCEKLNYFVRLTSGDCDAIHGAFERARELTFASGADIQFMARTEAVAVAGDGLAYRYRDGEAGRRQILSFVTPGDFVNPFGTLSALPFRLCSASHCAFAVFPEADPFAHMGSFPRIGAAFSKVREFEAALLYDRIMALGAYQAPQRVAATLCTIQRRFEMAGLTPDFGDLRHYELAQATGLSEVHLSRTLRTLVEWGVLAKRNPIVIGDVAELHRLSEWPSADAPRA